MMKFFRPIHPVRWLMPGALFRMKVVEKTVCISFDDGPDPKSTPELLRILGDHKIRGLFFCSGSAAEKYPELARDISLAGHLIGNHGYSHLDGWKTGCEEYCKDVFLASQFTSDRIFRPPFGRIKPDQYRKLRKSFRIIMWDLMAYDFDENYGPEKNLKVLCSKIRSGSIVAMHDTRNSSCRYLLNRLIEFYKSAGYSFVIPHL